MNEHIFKDLKIEVDVDQLLLDLEYILTLTDWQNNQISLQYASEEGWHCGNGKSEWLADDEQKYIHYHSSLDGRYIKKLLVDLDFPVSRARLMRLPPKTCYTTHVDYYTRYHVPIITKPLQTFMIFPDFEPSVVRMNTGTIYWVNTLELHNFLNGTFEHRIHIVCNDGREEKNTESKYLSM